jgi:hypothetical protein
MNMQIEGIGLTFGREGHKQAYSQTILSLQTNPRKTKLAFTPGLRFYRPADVYA